MGANGRKMILQSDVSESISPNIPADDDSLDESYRVRRAEA